MQPLEAIPDPRLSLPKPLNPRKYLIAS